MAGDRRIGVGIVGANPERGWAARGHLPALRALPGYRLAAVATTRPDEREGGSGRIRRGARLHRPEAAE